MQNILILDLLSQILKETQKLLAEIIKIRTKLDSKNFQIAQKFGIIQNDMLVTKNSYRNTQRSFQPVFSKSNKKSPVTINFD